MSTLLNLGIKQEDGTYKNYTVSINDETNEWGKNCSVWEQQTKEEREAKADKKFCGNGKVVWTDGVIVKAEYNAVPTTEEAKDDLPF